ncbi:MAG: hypothetical protein ACRDX8_14750 [Acidimicrobiales bacterium]
MQGLRGPAPSGGTILVGIGVAVAVALILVSSNLVSCDLKVVSLAGPRVLP